MNKNNGIVYQMTETQFQTLAKTRKDESKNMDPTQYVLKIVNDTYGIKGNVVGISFYDTDY